MTIKSRLLLATNGLVLAAILVLGWVALHASDHAVARRLLDDSAGNTLRLIRRLNLPASNRLARDLAEILDAEIALWEAPEGKILGSSPGAIEAAAFLTTLAGNETLSRREVVVAGVPHRVGVAAFSGEDGEAIRVAVMIAVRDLRVAQRRVRRGIFWVIGAFAAAASLVGLLVASGIYRPLRDLSSWVNGMASSAIADGATPHIAPPRSSGPPEVRGLAADVDRLLVHLRTLQNERTREEKLVAVGRFSMAIAHELRNPLSGIKLNAELAARSIQKRTGESDRSLDLVIGETERMQFILNELLGLVEGESSGDEPLPAKCDVNATVSKVLEFMTPRLAGADVRTAWQETGVTNLPCSAVELEQVLYNLLANSIDALPAGGVIELNCGRKEDGTRVFSVADNGPGTGLQNIGDIFAPFVTSRKRGAGLGLYVSRRIVERRGGTIEWVRENGWTVFRFSFPKESTA